MCLSTFSAGKTSPFVMTCPWILCATGKIMTLSPGQDRVGKEGICLGWAAGIQQFAPFSQSNHFNSYTTPTSSAISKLTKERGGGEERGQICGLGGLVSASFQTGNKRSRNPYKGPPLLGLRFPSHPMAFENSHLMLGFHTDSDPWLELLEKSNQTQVA